MNRKDADTARATGPTPAEPNGCRHCGQPQRTHFQRWWGPPNHPDGPGWHGWTEPTDEQRKARMLSRRLGPSPWRDDWMPATKETLMNTPAEPWRPDAIDDVIANWLAMSDYAHARDAYAAARNLREVLDSWGYDVAPRASQAATATNGPGDDHGAGAGQDNPAAANSGARMRPEDVPEELVELAVRFNTDCCHKDICGCDTWPDACHEGFLPGEFEHGNERKVIAAAIPAIRAAIADEIEAEEAKIDRRSSDQASWHSNGMIAAANLIRAGDQ